MRDVTRHLALGVLFASVVAPSGGCLTAFPARGGGEPDALVGVSGDARPTGPDALSPAADGAPADAAAGALPDARAADSARPGERGLRIEPSAVEVRFEQTLDLQVVELDADGVERDRTAEAAWRTADPEVVAVSTDPATPGRLYPLAVGRTTLVAVVDERASPPANVRVSPPAGTPPRARLVCPATGAPGVSLSFDASGSTDPEGPLSAWLFDFGDGSEPSGDGTQPVVEHTFVHPGRYTVRLIVVDGSAATDAATCEVEVGPAVATPSVQVLEPESGRRVAPGETLVVAVEVNAVRECRGPRRAAPELCAPGGRARWRAPDRPRPRPGIGRTCERCSRTLHVGRRRHNQALG